MFKTKLAILAFERSQSDPEYEDFWEEKAKYEDEERGQRSRSSSSLDSDDHVRVFEDGPFRADVVFEDRFRSVPDTTTFLPLLVDASKAASRFPSCKSSS
jgi:hypothetical protein